MTELSKQLDEATPELEEVQRTNAQLRELLARRDLKVIEQDRALKRAVKERDEAVLEADYITQLKQGNTAPPNWMRKKTRRNKDHHATVGLMLSDLHLDEVVKPEEMRWVNAFDRGIAEKRFERCIETPIMLTDEFFAGLKYDGIVVLWAGDVFSGIIHEELRETNAASMFNSLHHWEPIVAGAFERLVAHYGKLHVAVTVGNHGRRSEKWRAKGRAEESFEWLFAHNIADHHFKGSKNVTFDIPTSFDTHVNVYDHRLHLEHGDNFKGGAGIAGAMSPLLLGVHRTTRQAIGEQRMLDGQVVEGMTPVGDRMFDVMALGHWHQYIVAPSKGLIVNGSLKGYDEYARAKKFEPELAQQAMWLWTPEHGITFASPVIVQDRAKENW